MDDIADKNQKHWDSAAKTYDTLPWQQRLGDQITKDIRSQPGWLLPQQELGDRPDSESKALDYSKPDRRLLDYACGPGLLSHALAPYITTAIGIDISSAMVDEYNQRASSAGLAFRAVAGDLCSPKGVPDHLCDDRELYDFDIAGISLGFHHFEHLQLSLCRLVQRLRPGGVLIVVDFCEDMDGDFVGNEAMKKAAHTVAHKKGFNRGEVEKLFMEAGCKDFEWVVFASKVTLGEGGKEKWVFLARGVKAGS